MFLLCSKNKRPPRQSASRPTLRQGSSGERRFGSREAAGLPGAAAELGAVDDAGILIAGGAELDGAGHRAVADAALEAVGHVARLVARTEAEAHGFAVEHALPQADTVQRVTAAVPDDLEPRHPIDALRVDDLAVDAVELPKPLRDRGAVVEPFLALGGGIALAEPIFEGSDDADDVFLRHLHRPAQRLMRRAVAPRRLAEPF